MTQYGWPPEDVNREIIDAIERQYNAGAPPEPGTPWAAWRAIQRATAPPRQQSAATDPVQLPSHAPLSLVRATSSERE